ncbi:hypothetical protein [Archaeoglobus sp. UBA231]|nr:hypothetical protein [Archaeoglobus sp. UBA231]
MCSELDYLKKLNEMLFTAFTFSSYIWIYNSREEMIKFFADIVFDNELCTAVVISDKTGEYYRMDEDVMSCKYLNYQPKRFGFVNVKECSCKNFNHKYLLTIPICENSAVYLFLTENYEEIVQILKDMTVVLSRAIEHFENRKAVEGMVKRLEANLEYFQFLADRLRNPLAVILGVTELENEIGLGKGIKMIRESAEKMKKVLDDLGDAEISTKRAYEKILS